MKDELLLASPDELRDLAKHLSPKIDGDRHWSRLAVIVGRVDDENLWEDWGHGSARVWASDELGIPPRDFTTMIELWHMMQTAQPKVPIHGWADISKSTALLVKKVISLGGSVADLVLQAKTEQDPSAFRKTVEGMLHEGEWKTLTVKMPAELFELCEAAMILALPDALEEPHPDKGRIKDHAVRFRCLEVIVTEFVQQHAVGAECSEPSQPEALHESL